MKKFLALFLLLALLLTSTPMALSHPDAIVTPSGLTMSQMEREIERIMAEYVGTTTPGSALVIVLDGEIIFSRGFGYADTQNQIPVDPATHIFEHASIGKTFVYVAVMQLVEEGLLDLDTDIMTYLPNTFVFDMPFTMRHLLNHTAGFAEYFSGMDFDPLNLPSLEEALHASRPVQAFVPGTISSYSNWGVALAAFVVSQIRGQNFVDVELEHILIPAGMEHTLNLPHWINNDAFRANSVVGYVPDGNGGFVAVPRYYAIAYPAGALNGTAEDQARFIIALSPKQGESGVLFNDASTLETLFSQSSPDHATRPDMYHGFFRYDGVLPAFGHGGSLAGSSTDFWVVPDMRFGYVLFNNVAGEMDLVPAIAHLLLGVSNPQVPTGQNLPHASAVEGTFVPTRRVEGNFLEVVAYLGLLGMPLLNVQALDESRILLPMGALGDLVYVQVAPYTFQIYNPAESGLFGIMLPQVQFQMEEGVPVLLMSSAWDMTALEGNRTMPLLLFSLLTAVLAIAFFLVAPIALFVVFLVRRKKATKRTAFQKLHTGLLLTGAALVANLFTMMALVALVPWRPFSEFTPFLVLNWVLSALALILCAACVWAWKKCEVAKSRKIFFVTTAVILGLFIYQLANWNFFVF